MTAEEFYNYCKEHKIEKYEVIFCEAENIDSWRLKKLEEQDITVFHRLGDTTRKIVLM